MQVVERLTILEFASTALEPLHPRSFGQGAPIGAGPLVERSFPVVAKRAGQTLPFGRQAARDRLPCRSIRGRRPGRVRNSVDAAIPVQAATRAPALAATVLPTSPPAHCEVAR